MTAAAPTTPSASPPPTIWRATLARTATVVALLTTAVCAIMLGSHLAGWRSDPYVASDLPALKARLAADPGNEALKAQIRDLDVALRAQFFRQRELNHTGAYLAVIAGALFLLGLRLAYAEYHRPNVAAPTAVPGGSGPTYGPTRAGRWMVGSVGLATAGGLVAATVLVADPTAPSQRGSAKVAAAATGPASAPASAPASGPSTLAAGPAWPAFRGVHGDGIAPAVASPRTAPEVLWKAPLPLAGHSSAIVAGGRVVVTGGSDKQRQVLAFDAATGQQLWAAAITTPAGAPPTDISDDTGYACPTPVLVGDVVVAMFGTGDLAGVDLNGKVLWTRNLGPINSSYGYASSLAGHRDFAIVQLDQNMDGDAYKSALLGVDARTGQERWRVERPVEGSWTSPIVLPLGGVPTVLTVSNPLVIAHDATTGQVLWQTTGTSGDVAPSPIVAGGRVIAISPSDKVLALEPAGGAKPKVAWSYTDIVPDITSPVSDGRRLWLLATPGELVCLDLATGKALGQGALETTFHASPTLVGSQLLLVSEEGQLLLGPAAEQFQAAHQLALGESVSGSPTVIGDRAYVRGAKHLFCVGLPGAAAASQPAPPGANPE